MNTDLVLPAPATEIEVRQELARIPITQPPGLFGRALGWVSHRMYGSALDNGFAMAHNKRVLFATAAFERRVAKWNALDKNLKALAVMATSVDIGCSWCVDFGYFQAHADGLDLVKLQHVSQWRDSDVYSPVERHVIEYAQAMNETPPAVTDEMVRTLRSELSDAAVIELTMMVAVENQRSRFNAALGLVAQGFSASCQLPSRP
jgi:AhpD family alkylhydroperoxidase